MWNYSDKVKDHFLNPRNVGEVENADGVGEVGSMACGDALKLTFKLDEDKKTIVDVRFKTFGCGSAIASASALTELVKGKTLEEAKKITNNDIADFLKGLPEQKMHCSVMGREALEAAIENFETDGRVKHTIEGKIVCKCFNVTEKEIEQVVEENNLTEVEQVTNYIKAGGGCGKCKPDIEEIIKRVRAQKEPETGITNLEKIEKIKKVINEDIRPALQNDNGDIELLDVDGDNVVVALKKACASCPVSEMTLKDFVEKKLRESVMPTIVVKERSV